MSDNYHYLREILSSADSSYKNTPTEHNQCMRNVHFLMDFGPWNGGEYAEHIFIDYHTESMRQLSGGGNCIRNCKIKVSTNGMIQAVDEPKAHTFQRGDLSNLTRALDAAKDAKGRHAIHKDYVANPSSPRLVPVKGEPWPTSFAVKQGTTAVTSKPGELPVVLKITELQKVSLKKDDILVATFKEGTDQEDLRTYAKELQTAFRCRVLAKEPSLKIVVIEPEWVSSVKPPQSEGSQYVGKSVEEVLATDAKDPDIEDARKHITDKFGNRFDHLFELYYKLSNDETDLEVDHSIDFKDLVKGLRATYEEAAQTTMDLINGYAAVQLKKMADPQLMPQEDPKDGCYVQIKEVLHDGHDFYSEALLKPGTLLEGISQKGPRDAVICARYLASHDGQPTYVYIVRTFVWGNLCRLTAAEIASQFRVTSRTHPVELIPAWSLVRNNESYSKMEYNW